MSSRSGRCCGSDPAAGPDSGSIFGSGGPGLAIGPGPGIVSSSSCSESFMELSSDSISGSGVFGGSGSFGAGFGTSPGSLGIGSTPGLDFILDSGLGLLGIGPDFDFGSSLASLVSILFGPDSLASTSWP